ncbi:LemA family protein [Patescibacteria group bacterium]|nr:LemA family protein [Patescibacteria group bacterium]MCL5409573.1 LemA family protein [Patescibacteria group bacterium]
MAALYVVLGILGLLLIWVFTSYNNLVTIRNRVHEAWSEIDVQLKRRSSLIPNLVETVKGYAKHEKEVFENVTKARSALMSAGNPGEAAKANDQLSGALKSLFAVAENYPTLRASENFKALQDELSDTENKVAAARQFYNTNVLDLNNTVQTIPSIWIAQLFGFQKAEFFQASEEEKADVNVKF